MSGSHRSLAAVLLGVVLAVVSGVAALAFVSDGPLDRSSEDGASVAPVSPSPGRVLFQAKGCSGCHSLAGVSTSPVGPDLSNLALRAGNRRPGYSSEDYARESIREPQAFIVTGYGGVQMPTLPVTDDELEALVAFLLGRP